MTHSHLYDFALVASGRLVGPGNGSPMATNVVVVLVLGVIVIIFSKC